MAVTLTQAELSAALRLGTSAEEIAESTRLLEYATEAVAKHAPDAPDTVHNEAVIRLAGYLYDQPFAARGASYANAIRNSGSSRMLLPYRVHRAGSTAEAISEAEASGSVDNPVTDVQIVSGNIIVSYADGSTETHALPAGMGGTGVDQTARDAAAAASTEAATAQAAADTKIDTAAANALIAAHAANANAHHVPPTGGGGAVSESARLPVGTVAMRLGWAQTQTPTDAIFTRAGIHPTDGAAEGTVAGINPPPFPPALNTDTSLYLFIWIATARANIADIRLSGGGGTLIGSISNGAAFTLETVAGTVYVSNQRLSPGLSAYQISAIVGGELIASRPWVTERIAAIPEPTAGTTFTSLGAVSMSGGSYTAAATIATATANALIDDTGGYNALVVVLEDFNRHQNTWRLPLGFEDYAEGVNHQFYNTYVNNGTGAVHGMVFNVLRNTGAAATVTLGILGGGSFDAGTVLNIYGEA